MRRLKLGEAYPLHLDLAGAVQRPVTLDPATGFQYDRDALLAACRGAKLVLLISPNNPTGSVLPRALLEEVLGVAGGDGLVVVDEAYREFAGQDFAPLLGEGVPLLLLRTFSKAMAMAMAGLRFGYLLAPSAVAAELDKVALPYAVNSLTQAAVELLVARPALLSARVEAGFLRISVGTPADTDRLLACL